MRIFVSLFIGFLIISMNSCSSEDIENLQSNKSDNGLSHTISIEEALNIANITLNYTTRNYTTRSNNNLKPNVDYVLSNEKTRGDLLESDTLAYIINYPEDAGFVVVSSDDRVYPVLAFSDKGNFSMENEIVKKNFIYNIESYILNSEDYKHYDVSSIDFDGCFMQQPIIGISIGQGNPWDKYVIKEHPGCPVGCVPVATALTISHSCSQIRYHGVSYPMKSIISAIMQGPTEDDLENNTKKRITGGNPVNLPTYTYEQAVDSMAKLLYLLGKDLNVTYTPSGSGALSSKAYDLCKNLGFTIPSNYAIFDIFKISRYLQDNCIIYMRGRDEQKNEGHAWVADGCYFCVDKDDPDIITQTYIHCDWGWNGYCNGYYSGEVFNAGAYNFNPMNYFAVKRDPFLLK